MTRAGFRSLSLTLLSALSLALFACGGSSGDGDGDGDGDIGDPCEDATSCDGNAICDPTDNTCQDDVPCTDHAQCGKGGNCNMAAGTCEVSTTGSPCEGDDQCQRGEACVAADNVTGGFCGCDGEEFEPMPVEPNMLLIFDTSGSMGDPAGGGQTKYEAAQDAVDSLMTTFDGMIRFGLSMYAGACAANGINVDIGDNNGSAIINAIAGNAPGGGTPMGITLEGHLGYAGLMDPTRPNYILLMTDGNDTCSVDAPTAAGQHFNQGTKTFAVGFGDQTNINPAYLNGIANMGGTPQGAATDYYAASDAAALETAFNAIGGLVLSCSFQLTADEDALIRAFFDGIETSGFTFDPVNGVITFDDPAVCNQLQGGGVEELVIVNSCPIDTE